MPALRTWRFSGQTQVNILSLSTLRRFFYYFDTWRRIMVLDPNYLTQPETCNSSFEEHGLVASLSENLLVTCCIVLQYFPWKLYMMIDIIEVFSQQPGEGLIDSLYSETRSLFWVVSLSRLKMSYPSLAEDPHNSILIQSTALFSHLCSTQKCLFS